MARFIINVFAAVRSERHLKRINTYVINNLNKGDDLLPNKHKHHQCIAQQTNGHNARMDYR